MKILVTGGAGFIGSNFVRKIIEGSLNGISEITILDKLTYAGTLKNLENLPRGTYRFVQGDICDQDLVSKLAKNMDAIINFAAETHVDRSILKADEFLKSNVLGTQVLLDTLLKGHEKRFIQVSTDEVYGSIKSGSWKEDFPLDPNSPYAASKAAADLLCRTYHRTFNLDIIVTRCSNNYGPHQYPEKFIPLSITNLLEGKKIPIYGSGKNIRDWLHVEDHCRGIDVVLKNGKAGEIYNIGGGRELPNIELARHIISALSKSEDSIEFVADRKGHDFRYSVNFEKITRDLGYTPTVDFEKGISDTINWYKENVSWWQPIKKSMKCV